jgi:hypothetical protein
MTAGLFPLPDAANIEDLGLERGHRTLRIAQSSIDRE